MSESRTSETMTAVCRTPSFGVELRRVPAPHAEAGYLVIDVSASAINSGDKAWIGGAFPPGLAPESLYDVCGVSGVGRVLEIGDGVPPEFDGKKVAFYRSLRFGGRIVGTWCEYARMHHLHCIILPEDVDDEAWSGSLVNAITPYAFLEQVLSEGHEAVLATAGTSATGRAMLGLCQVRGVPLISIVRNDAGKQRLKELGGARVLARSDPDFDVQLKKLTGELNVTAVLEGVGGELIPRVARALPRGSTIYLYGLLGEDTFSLSTSLVLMSGLTVRGFGNFKSSTVTDPERLSAALRALGQLANMPHFETRVGKRFRPEEIEDAMAYSSHDAKGKAVLRFSPDVT